jgi:hypothetical protein
MTTKQVWAHRVFNPPAQAKAEDEDEATAEQLARALLKAMKVAKEKKDRE